MVRIILVALLLWGSLPSSLLAGEITDIRVEKEAQNEIEIIIEGDYQSYQAFSLLSPARFVIDLEAVQLKEGVPPSLEVKGPVVSGIRASQHDNSLRVVLDSADSSELFHSTIQDKEGELLLKCWMPKEEKAARAYGYSPPPDLAPDPILPKKDLGSLFGWPKEVEEEEKKEETEKVEVYTGEKISLDFFKTDIHNVFRLFAEISGKNIIVDDEVVGELTLALKEVPWDLAMDIILDLKSLAIVEKLNTFIVKSMPEKAETDKGKGELVVRKFSEEILQPARMLKRKKENRQQAQEIILKAHNLETQGNHKDALSLYEKAFDIWKDNIDLIKKTAYLHYILGNFARSYYFSGEALRLNPKDAGAALYAALSAARMDKPGDARQLFEIATKKAGPEIPEAFYDYGLFLEKQKDYGNALYIYRRYEDLFGPSLEVSLAIARLYEEQTRISEACKRYREIRFSGFTMDRNTESVVLKKIQTLCNQGED